MKGRSVGVIVLIIITLVLGVGAIIIGDQLTRQDVNPDDTSAFDPQSRVYGETCDVDADCKPSTVGFPSGCRTVSGGAKICVNTNCPNTTIWGTRGDCSNATNTCGQVCGGGTTGLCASGFVCTYARRDHCFLEGDDQQNSAKTYCVPVGNAGFNKGPIPNSWYPNRSETYARAACYNSNNQVSPYTVNYTANGNSFIYHPVQGTNYNREWTQPEIINYICNPPANNCGNGTVDAGEACDNGTSNSNTGAICNTSCQLNPECNDGQDNDGDAIVDCNGTGDPGCFPNGNGGGGSCDITDDSEENASIGSCNEGSGVIDFETVPGSTSPNNVVITNQYASSGVTFEVESNTALGTCTGRLQIGDYGGEGDAWGYPNNVANNGDQLNRSLHPVSESGNYFLSFAKQNGTAYIGAADVIEAHKCVLVINYSTPTTAASGFTADNEPGPTDTSTQADRLRIVAYNAAGQEVDRDYTGVIGNGGDGVLAGFNVTSTASNPITQIKIFFDADLGAGYGFDNFSAYCADAPLCGNGDVESGEECDDGDDNADTGALCNTQCELNPECNDGQDNDGDGATDCEAGAEDPGCFPNGRGGGGSCDPDDDSEVNTPAVCGDGVVDTGEICGEPGLSCSGGDTCQSCSCVTIGTGPVCGDGVMEGAEACDDGNQTAGDGCSAACTVTTQCNDGVDNDGDGRIDCLAGNADLGCFPDGNGGGGACNPLDNSELNAAPTTIPNTALISDEADRVIIGLILVAVAGLMIRFNVLINGYELLGKIQRVYLSKDEVKRTNINKD